MTEVICNPYTSRNHYNLEVEMSTRVIMPTLVQSGDTIVIGDHRWLVKSLSEPDHAGFIDAAMVDAQGHQKWSCLYDAVTIEV
jgi:hypothetical protein